MKREECERRAEAAMLLWGDVRPAKDDGPATFEWNARHKSAADAMQEACKAAVEEERRAASKPMSGNEQVEMAFTMFGEWCNQVDPDGERDVLDLIEEYRNRERS